MKRILSILTIAVFALSFSACDLLDSTPDRDTDSEIIIPDDSPSDDDSNNEGDNPSGEIDRSKYTQYNTTFTQGDAIYFGVYYEEQPDDVANWYIELADKNFDLTEYSGEGYYMTLEFFCKGTTPAAGTYTIEAFNKDPFSHMSLGDGFIEEYNGESYAVGTWLFQGSNAIAGATDGSMTIATSGSKYTVSYLLHDDEYQITFQGKYSGDLPLYDGTGSSATQAVKKTTKSTRAPYIAKPTKVFRVKK